MAARGQKSLFYLAAVFIGILVILQIVFPMKEGFSVQFLNRLGLGGSCSHNADCESTFCARGKCATTGL
jgi:hypothetical protein